MAETDLTDETLESAGKLAGDMLNRVLAQHEQEEHGGEKCIFERINVLAYLAHRMGLPLHKVDRADVQDWYTLLISRSHDYEACHEEHHLSSG